MLNKEIKNMVERYESAFYARHQAGRAQDLKQVQAWETEAETP